VLTGEHGPEQRQVLGVDGVEPGVSSAVIAPGTAQPFKAARPCR
jgi:hypothetical protein